MSERVNGGPSLPERESQPNGLQELLELQESLGFVETPELLYLHLQIVEAANIGDTETRRRAMTEYHDETLRIIGDNPPADIRRGFEIAKVGIKLEVGDILGCLDDLEDTLYVLRQESWHDQAETLSHIMRGIEFPSH